MYNSILKIRNKVYYAIVDLISPFYYIIDSIGAVKSTTVDRT